MSSFQLKPQFLPKSSNNAKVVANPTAFALNTYIENYSDDELYTLIQLGMQAASYGIINPKAITYSSNYQG